MATTTATAKQPNLYIECLAQHFYHADGRSVYSIDPFLRGTDWDEGDTAILGQGLSALRMPWSELPDCVLDAYRGVAETILGPAVRKAGER